MDNSGRTTRQGWSFAQRVPEINSIDDWPGTLSLPTRYTQAKRESHFCGSMASIQPVTVVEGR